MRFELSDRQEQIAQEFRSDLQRVPGEATARLASWAGVTVPRDLGGRALGQTEAVAIAEQLGCAGRDGTLLDLAAAAECLACAPPGGQAARVLRRLIAGTAIPGVAWHVAGGCTAAGTEPFGGHREFACGLPAENVLLRLGQEASGAEVFALVPTAAGVSWTPHRGVHAEDRFRVLVSGPPPGTAPHLLFAVPRRQPGAPGLADLARVRHAGYLWGLGRCAVDLAVRRARERQQFGTSIGVNQAVAFPLAALTARLHAARLLVHYTAWLADHADGLGESDRPYTGRVDDLLRHVTTLVLDATWCALHVHGASGLTETSTAQLVYRQALFHTALTQMAHPAAGAPPEKENP
jgi:alkylation response protein AidB-like acyl-CoA dehydrogenase